jgi:hypothetical protein
MLSLDTFSEVPMPLSEKALTGEAAISSVAAHIAAHSVDLKGNVICHSRMN